MSYPPRLLFRRATSQKTCPQCGLSCPADNLFCGECGASLSGVGREIRPPGERPPQFRIPDYLFGDNPASRRKETEPVGTGLIWIGVALIAIPAVTQNLSPISLGAWIIGVVAVMAGAVRARLDGGSMLRAGAVTSLAGVIALGVIAHGVLRPSDEARLPDDLAAVATSEQAAEPEETGSDPADGEPVMRFSGSVPMLRGSSAHTGVNPGPVIAGDPYRAWRYDTGRFLRSSPAIAGASAYVGTADGYLIALDLLTGLPRWRFDLGGYPVSSSPAVADRMVFVGSGYNVFAIDADRGTERWRFPMTYAGESSPTVADGVVYVASKEHFLYALDALTGEKQWSYRTDGLIFGSPSVSDELVLLGGDDGDVFAIDRETGISRWTYSAGSGIYSSIAIGDGRAIVTLDDRSVIALDLEGGDLLWEYPVGGPASPAVAEGLVYVGSSDGALYALAGSAGGPPAWLFPTGSSTVLSPVVVDDTVYLAAGPTLFALDRETGEEQWRYPIGDDAATEPVVVDGLLYLGTEDGNLVAITGDDQEATPSPAAE
jgi:outer membrane protein assembly factor BamB